MRKGIFEELKKNGNSDFYPFHMPGHKRNSESGPLSIVYQYDITEIDGFDNLHAPQGLIKEAQEYAASLYHSEETYYLVGGSTAGILSAVSAIAEKGKKLIIARNCHRSVYHGAFLNQLELEYIYPNVSEDFGISAGITKKQVEEKLKEIAEREDLSTKEIPSLIAGIVLTSPTYDGILSDVKGIVKAAHAYGIPVIVDQAHGAHFGFHPAFPENAVSEGADIVVHSVHKTLPAPTQTALLHRNGSLVRREAVSKYLRIYQSSSPSYLLMAGIDSCMQLLETEGSKRFDNLLLYRKKLMEEVKSLKCIRIYSSVKDAFQEPARLLISVRGTAITGQQFYHILREKYHLQMEMCGADYVIAILSLMDREEGFVRLAKALLETDRMLQEKEKEGERPVILPSYQEYQPTTALTIRKAYMEDGVYIPLEEAAEKITADFVSLYPPGIPILVPGEKIDNRLIQMVTEYLDGGYTVQGIRQDHENIKYAIKVWK